MCSQRHNAAAKGVRVDKVDGSFDGLYKRDYGRDLFRVQMCPGYSRRSRATSKRSNALGNRHKNRGIWLVLMKWEMSSEVGHSHSYSCLSIH